MEIAFLDTSALAKRYINEPGSAYDAVQLSVAEQLNRRQIEMKLLEVTFVSADNELLAAASSDGLLIENPKNYNK